MKNLIIYTLLFSATLLCSRADWEVVWRDEFDSPTLDLSKWSVDVNCWGGGNGELECYTSNQDNIRIDNGSLILEAKRQPGYIGSNDNCTTPGSCTGPRDYTSGKVVTRGPDTGSWLYGKFEARIKLPKGKFLWPAFWMLPTDSVYGSWAASGEMDIMEYRGQSPDVVLGTIHYSSEWPNNRWTSSGEVSFPFDFSEDYHVFGLEWELDWIRWYVDDQKYFEQYTDKNWYQGAGTNHYTANRQPWDQRFFILLNLAIGGGFFNGMGDLTPDDVATTWTQPYMAIDWVRVSKNSSSVSNSSSVTNSSLNENSIDGKEIIVQADSYVNQDQSSNNYGNETSLQLGQSSHVLLRFDLESLSHKKIKSVKLSLNIDSAQSSQNATANVTLYLVKCWFDEDEVNWDNAPTSTEIIRYAMISYPTMEIDVTESAQEAMTRDKRLSILLAIEETTDVVISFISKESSEKAQIPTLHITH